VYGFVQPLDVRATPLRIWGLVGADRRWVRAHTPAEASTASRLLAEAALLSKSLRFHAMRTAGAVLGSRAGRLPDAAVTRLSLERRGRSRDRT